MSKKNPKNKAQKQAAQDQPKNPQPLPPTAPSQPPVVKDTHPPVIDGGKNDNQQGNVPPPGRSINWDRWLAAAIAVAAIIQAWTSYWQLSAMRDQNIVMMDQTKLMQGQLGQMELDQRPWIIMNVSMEEP